MGASAVSHRRGPHFLPYAFLGRVTTKATETCRASSRGSKFAAALRHLPNFLLGEPGLCAAVFAKPVFPAAGQGHRRASSNFI